MENMQEPPTGVHAAILAELAEIGVENTGLGQIALNLAARIDSDQDGGTALAAMSKQLTATMLEIKGQTPLKQQSKLDELRKRRESRKHA